MNKSVNLVYPGFTYPGNELSAYTFTVDTFIISLKNGNVINHKPDDADKFRLWLADNKIRNIADRRSH